MGKKAKKPIVSSSKYSLKPATREVNYDDTTPVFCFHYLDTGYGLANCSPDEMVALVKRLVTLSQMKWSEIKKAPRHGLGTEFIPLAEMKKAPTASFFEGVERLMVFRFCGKAPIVGHRVDNVFHICFLDTKFDLYGHG